MWRPRVGVHLCCVNTFLHHAVPSPSQIPITSYAYIQQLRAWRVASRESPGTGAAAEPVPLDLTTYIAPASCIALEIYFVPSSERVGFRLDSDT